MSAQMHEITYGAFIRSLPASIAEALNGLCDNSLLCGALVKTATGLVIEFEIVRRESLPLAPDHIGFQGTATVFNRDGSEKQRKVEGLLDTTAVRGHLCFLPDDFQL